MKRVFITGDIHGSFARIKQIKKFCKEKDTSKEDVLILLGDVGANYTLGERDIQFKEALSSLPVTIVCIHGNHEERPVNISSYQLVKHGTLGGAECWIEYDFPNILFPKDGIVNIFGKRCLILGGAYSVDKWYRKMNGLAWFPEEQMSIKEQNRILSLLDKENEFDYIFSHTCPSGFVPKHLFLGCVDQNSVDKTMEYFLQEVYNKIEFKEWFFGHYHSDESNEKMRLLFNTIIEL